MYSGSQSKSGSALNNMGTMCLHDAMSCLPCTTYPEPHAKRRVHVLPASSSSGLVVDEVCLSSQGCQPCDRQHSTKSMHLVNACIHDGCKQRTAPVVSAGKERAAGSKRDARYRSTASCQPPYRTPTYTVTPITCKCMQVSWAIAIKCKRWLQHMLTRHQSGNGLV